MNLFVRIGVIIIAMIIMAIVIYVFEKETREVQRAIDEYYVDIHSFFHEEDED